MRRPTYLGAGLLMFVAFVASAVTAQAAPMVATIEVKGMVFRADQLSDRRVGVNWTSTGKLLIAHQ